LVEFLTQDVVDANSHLLFYGQVERDHQNAVEGIRIWGEQSKFGRNWLGLVQEDG